METIVLGLVEVLSKLPFSKEGWQRWKGKLDNYRRFKQLHGEQVEGDRARRRAR